MTPRLRRDGDQEAVVTLCAACKIKPVPSKRAKYCGDTCRKRARRAGVVVALQPKASESDIAPTSGVTTATRSALEAAGRSDTPAGAGALVIAARLDAGGDTGSMVAAMVKELRASMAEALAGAKVDDDKIDELRDRRLRRVGG